LANVKARDIIPGWPRGRSTSPFCANMSALEYMHWPRHLPFDARFAEDLVGELAEELRKAEMMEGYWEQQRSEARGPLYPQSMGEGGLAIPERER
jgi:hypothetical protein